MIKQIENDYLLGVNVVTLFNFTKIIPVFLNKTTIYCK